MKPHTFGRAGLVLPALFAAVALMVACDEAFEPLSPGRQALVSVFGYLDPSADTQWIRVMPIRPLKTTSPDSFDVSVTLTEVGSGRIIALRDSLIRFTPGPAATDSATAFVHDFWTAARIKPGATYRFSATRPGEPTTEAVVKVPQRFTVTVSLHQPNFSDARDFARVSGVGYVPFSKQMLRFLDGCGSGEDTIPYRAASAENGTATLTPIADTVGRRGTGQCRVPVVTMRHLWVAAADSTWPAPQEFPVLGLGASERASTLTNALGFLGGVLTMQVPYSKCTFATQIKWPFGTSSGVPGPKPKYAPEWCELRFDSVAATRSGRVVETRCGDGPVDSATVRFTEVSDSARTQFTVTTTDGTFEFGALKPGVRYNLYVYGKLRPSLTQFTNVYSTIDDTVTFAPGEHRTGDLYIQRLIPCDQK